MVDSGHITVDVELVDSAEESGVTAQKVVSLSRRDEYSSGKVAVVTGTCGTARLVINPLSLPYQDAANNVVSLESVRRIVLYAEPGAFLYRGIFVFPFGCSRGEPCVTSEYSEFPPAQGYAVSSLPGTTSSFTLILYGT